MTGENERNGMMDSASDISIYHGPSAATRFYLAAKRTFFRICKYLGLFHLARRLTAKGLRIVCYHGFSTYDEHRFSPRTFMDPDKFRRRMLFLQKKGFPILGLDEALDLLEGDGVPPGSLVITIDDGFRSVHSHVFPILRELSIPATIYITSYASMKKNPVFRLVVLYMFWKTTSETLDLDGLGLQSGGNRSIVDREERERLIFDLIRHGESSLDEEGRCGLARLLGERLGVDYGSIEKKGMLSIMGSGEIVELSEAGIDIELHTHRHRFPTDSGEAIREISDNRGFLEPIVGRPLVHFCYPSGIYSEKQWPWLLESGIRSAVTCERGLNFADTPKYGLKRFGDDEILSQIEFEAEIYGFTELLRKINYIRR